MKKVIIDLSVVTVANYPRLGTEFDYKRKQEALLFLEKVTEAAKSGELGVITPKNFYALVGEWQHKEIVLKILEFYRLVTSEFVETADLIAELIEMDIDYEDITASLVKRGVKGEDALIVVTASLKQAVIVTYNKKDLRDKLVAINEILAGRRMTKIAVKEPSEFESELGRGGFSA